MDNILKPDTIIYNGIVYIAAVNPRSAFTGKDGRHICSKTS